MTNGILEGINSLIQAAKAKARVYRSNRNFITTVYLIAGKLNFLCYPHTIVNCHFSPLSWCLVGGPRGGGWSPLNYLLAFGVLLVAFEAFCFAGLVLSRRAQRKRLGATPACGDRINEPTATTDASSESKLAEHCGRDGQGGKKRPPA